MASNEIGTETILENDAGEWPDSWTIITDGGHIEYRNDTLRIGSEYSDMGWEAYHVDNPTPDEIKQIVKALT